MKFRRNQEAAPDTQDIRRSALYKRIAKYGTRGITVIGSSEGARVSPEVAQFLRPATGDEEPTLAPRKESALEKRLRKYGTRGITIVDSPEGQPVSREDVQYLRPAGLEDESTDKS